MSEPKLPRLLKGPQVEREYGIKHRTLVSYVKRGIIGCVRVGRQVMYDRLAIEDFIAKGGQALPGGSRPKKAKQ